MALSNAKQVTVIKIQIRIQFRENVKTVSAFGKANLAKTTQQREVSTRGN